MGQPLFGHKEHAGNGKWIVMDSYGLLWIFISLVHFFSDPRSAGSLCPSPWRWAKDDSVGWSGAAQPAQGKGPRTAENPSRSGENIYNNPY